jgi:hypothetical protein
MPTCGGIKKYQRGQDSARSAKLRRAFRRRKQWAAKPSKFMGSAPTASVPAAGGGSGKAPAKDKKTKPVLVVEEDDYDYDY